MRIVSPDNFDEDRLAREVGNRPVWIHVDWDVLNPGYVPADYAVPNGLPPTQVRRIFSLFAESVVGIELAEYCVTDRLASSPGHLEVIRMMVEPALQASLKRDAARFPMQN